MRATATKRLTSSAAFLLAASMASAFAADLPSRKGPPAFAPPPPPPMWTGFYIGLNAGGLIGAGGEANSFAHVLSQSTDRAYAPAFAAAATNRFSPDDGGFIGGGQIGFNWQFENVWVAGFEADFQGTTARGQASGANYIPVVRRGISDLPVGSATQISKSLDWLGTVRGRIGYLVTPTLLTYATGGFAYGQVSASTGVLENILNQPTVVNTFGTVPPMFGAGSYADMRLGWTAGAGGEWLFHPNWSAKVEYLYYDLGSASHLVSPLSGNIGNCACGGNGVASVVPISTVRFNGHIVRAGLNYHFNWGAPGGFVAY